MNDNQERINEFLDYAKDNILNIKILVAGSREFSDYQLFKQIMNSTLSEFPDCEFISGKASRGPDAMVIEYAKDVGVICHEYPADWNNIGVPNARIKTNDRGRQYNANAGHDRNQVMADLADFYLIFWDGKSPGTRDMIKRAEKNIKYGIVFMV